jgi:hypothetical protein
VKLRALFAQREWRGVGLGPRDKKRKLNHKNTIKGENTFPPFAVAWPVSVRNKIK